MKIYQKGDWNPIFCDENEEILKRRFRKKEIRIKLSAMKEKIHKKKIQNHQLC
jgi:hypothetical protein